MRAFLTVIVGAMLLGSCAAKPTVKSTQAVSAQQDGDSAACLVQPIKKESYDERQKSFASCMSAKGYHEDKLDPSEVTANAGYPLISNGLNDRAPASSPELAAGEAYERAVADYNSCVLEHTSNLSTCQKQQALMNGLGKVSSRLSLSQNYLITPRISQTTNTAGITQGANTANTIQATLSQVPARISQTPQATPSQTPTPIAPPTASSRMMTAPISLAPTSSVSAPGSPPAREIVADHPEPVDEPSSQTPIPF